MNAFRTASTRRLAAPALAFLAAGGFVACDDSEDSTLAPITCADGLCTIRGELTAASVSGLDGATVAGATITLDAGTQYLLTGGVFIGDDVNESVLELEPGTTLYGDTATKAFLTVRRGSKIHAHGTADAPIVMTSAKAEGTRARGDWGGLVINGNAPINGCASGTCEAEGEGGSGLYGGSDPADDSGVLEYVRVEFAGHPVTPEDELNGIAFQGVGNGTTIDYVQVHMAADDGIEFFGGTAEFKHVLTTGISDDNLDWTDGWQGKGQFFVAQQYSDKGDNGIEADNNGDDNTAAPRSFPVLSNLTLIGSPNSDASDIGILLREGTAANIHNAVVVGWNDACFDIDNAETFANAYDGTDMTGELVLADSVLACATAYNVDDEKDADDNALTDAFSLVDFVESWNTGNTVTTDWGSVLGDATNETTPGLAPVAAGPADEASVLPAGDAFFTAADFKGGVDPSSDWTVGWTTNARN